MSLSPAAILYSSAGTAIATATTTPGGADLGLVTRIAGSVSVTGTITSITNPVSVTGTLTSITNPVTVAQATPANLKGQVYGSDGNILATANVGRLQVDVVSGGGSNASVGTIAAAAPGSATYVGMNQGGNLVGFTGTTGYLNVNIAGHTSVVSVDDNGSTLSIDDGGGSITVDGTVTVTQTTPANLRSNVYGSDGNVLATANAGRLQVDIISGGGSNASVGTTGAAVPASATFAGMNVSGNLTGFTGTGTSLNVNLTNSSIAVTDNGGSLTIDGTVAATQSGPWDIGTLTTITNAVTVAQATAANLNATVIQPTAANLNATVVQATGSNLHTVVDSGVITTITNAVTVSQATAANLQGQVVGSDGNILATANTGRLQVDIVTGGGSNASVGATGAAVPASGTYAAMNQGGNLVGLTGTSGNLNVNVANTVNVADNGSSLTVDGSVDVGTVTTITNAVTVAQNTASSLNATVVQPTGTNLHTVVDSGTITTVTNAVTVAQNTASNLNATVSQPTGSDLHTVVDSGTITSITNAVTIQDGGNTITVDGTVNVGTVTTLTSITNAVTIQDGGNTITVDGGKTNNNAAPGATNIGALTAVATAAAPTYTEGNLVALSTDLTGAMRITGSISASPASDGLTGAAVPTSASYMGVNVGGNLVGVTGTGTSINANITNTVTVAGNKTNNNAAPGANNTGTLPAIANAAAPTWVEGNQVGLSVDLAGLLRTTPTGTKTLSDAFSNPTDAQAAGAFLMGWDEGGAVWRRVSIDPTNTDGVAVHTTASAVDVDAHLRLFNGTTFDRWYGGGTNADAVPASALGAGDERSFLFGFNGSTWDRLKGDATNGLYVNLRASNATLTVAGNKSNNTAAPGATNTGTFPAVATAAAPTYNEGNQVALSTDLTGHMRVVGSFTPNVDNYAPTDAQYAAALLYGADGNQWDRVKSVANNADGVAATAGGQLASTVYTSVFNGTTWDRLSSGTTAADAQTAPTTGVANVRSFLFGWNGATYDRIKSSGTGSDGEATTSLGYLETLGYNKVFNGTTWDRQRGNTTATFVQGPGAAAATITGNPVLAGGSDGTNARIIRTDTSGYLQVTNVGSALASSVSASMSGPWANSNNATSVKGSAGNLYGYYAANTANQWRYLKFYNKATAPAPATDNALLMLVVAIPPGAGANLSFNPPMHFSSGIGYAVVTGISNTDNTAVNANDGIHTLWYT